MISPTFEATGLSKVEMLLDMSLGDKETRLTEPQLEDSGTGASQLVIAASGLWIIDVHLDAGKLETKPGGTWRQPDSLLFVNGRHRFDLVEAIVAKRERAQGWVESLTDDLVPVHGALCFGRSGVGLLDGFTFIGEVSGVWVGGANRLVREIKSDRILSLGQLDSLRSSLTGPGRRSDD